MKKRIAAFLLSALFILTCGCTPSDTETAVPDTEPQTVTDTETDAETEEEKIMKKAGITVNSLTVSDKISLDLTVKTEPADLSGKLTCTLKKNDSGFRNHFCLQFSQFLIQSGVCIILIRKYPEDTGNTGCNSGQQKPSEER